MYFLLIFIPDHILHMLRTFYKKAGDLTSEAPNYSHVHIRQNWNQEIWAFMFLIDGFSIFAYG